MIDNTKGNYGVNAHSSYNNEKHQQKETLPEKSVSSELKQKEINLDNQPAAIMGQTYVTRSSAAKNEKGAYKFDPDKVEQDVREFDIAIQFASMLTDAGYPPEHAAEAALELLEKGNFDIE